MLNDNNLKNGVQVRRRAHLAPFRRFCVFYVLLTPPLFHPNFGGVPVAPNRPSWGQPEQRT